MLMLSMICLSGKRISPTFLRIYRGKYAKPWSRRKRRGRVAILAVRSGLQGVFNKEVYLTFTGSLAIIQIIITLNECKEHAMLKRYLVCYLIFAMFIIGITPRA
jgi:hypothetical protein